MRSFRGGGLAAAVTLSIMLLGTPRSAAGGPAKFSILAPATFTSTSSEQIFVIASATDEIQGVALSVNGGPSIEPLKVDKGAYHFRARLALGLNLLELKGSTGDATIAESIGVFRTSKVGMRIRSPFPKYLFHTEQAEAACSGCHDTGGSEAASNDLTTMNSLCLKCHNSLVSEKHVHGPIAVGTCAICHSFTSEPNRYQLNQDSFDLCLLCHTKKAQGLKEKTHTHGPLGAGLCDICHDPHSSPNHSQLRQPGGEICLVCHKQVESVFATDAFLHPPFEQRKCYKCHDAHYSDYGFLLIKKGDQMCRSCHEKNMEKHRHPVGVVPRASLPFEARYGEEGELVCITCHDPHAGGKERMLPKEGCPACHDM